jgi:thiosulfate dehydrogenase
MVSKRFAVLMIFTGLAILTILLIYFHLKQKSEMAKFISKPHNDSSWTGPDTLQIPTSTQGELIRYGRSLIANTAYYLGPKGKVAHISNGMNCQNCHLDAGTKPWGNNFGGVFSTYPKFRERRGAIENIYQRINDCFQRSLNGQELDSNSREMQAILAYMKWIGTGVPKGKKPIGSGIQQLAFLTRAADPEKGRLVYELTCKRCHGADGEGMVGPNPDLYIYPPLWGSHSYNTGAGLYRLTRFAGYVKDNMPFGAKHNNTQISDEDAWDVSAFVNSRPRPIKYFNKDWPDISLKPVDHPFGPYLDSFSEQQHKYGPFKIIQKPKEIADAKK